MIKHYRPDQVRITFNGEELIGFLDGTLIEQKREELHYKLDEMALAPYRRLYGATYSMECSIWDESVGLWAESDEHLRQRIKEDL